MRKATRDYSWGPSLTADGGIRFRLWAPAEESLSLRLAGRDIPMAAGEGGWFETVIEDRPFGADYGYVLSNGSFVPDPASRHQADVLGASTLIDPDSYAWQILFASPTAGLIGSTASRSRSSPHGTSR